MTEVVTAASDPQTGTLYVVWQDARFESGLYDEVALSRSLDEGEHWTEPVRVNAKHGVPGVMPAIALDRAGLVAVSFMDWRGLRAGDETTLPANYWLAISRDQANTFQERAISKSFDMIAAPESNGKFVGDYMGLAPCQPGFCAVYATTNAGQPGNPTDIQFSALSASFQR